MSFGLRGFECENGNEGKLFAFFCLEYNELPPFYESCLSRKLYICLQGALLLNRER